MPRRPTRNVLLRIAGTRIIIGQRESTAGRTTPRNGKTASLPSPSFSDRRGGSSVQRAPHPSLGSQYWFTRIRNTRGGAGSARTPGHRPTATCCRPYGRTSVVRASPAEIPMSWRRQRRKCATPVASYRFHAFASRSFFLFRAICVPDAAGVPNRAQELGGDVKVA